MLNADFGVIDFQRQNLHYEHVKLFDSWKRNRFGCIWICFAIFFTFTLISAMHKPTSIELSGFHFGSAKTSVPFVRCAIILGKVMPKLKSNMSKALISSDFKQTNNRLNVGAKCIFRGSLISVTNISSDGWYRCICVHRKRFHLCTTSSYRF